MLAFGAGIQDGAVLVWDTLRDSDQVTRRLWAENGYDEPSSVNFIRFSPDGRWIVSGGDSTYCNVWDSAPGSLHQVLRGHDSWVTVLS